MALTRQQNLLGQQRVDAPDLRSMESAVANDFDLLAGKTLGGEQALVIRGFTIDTTNSLNNPATQLVLRAADGILMHWGATEAGTLLQVPDDQEDDTLNSANTRVVGGFAASSLNYVGIDYRRSADATTSDITKFVSATTNQESTRTVPKARTLSYDIVISTTPFSLMTNVCPIARVETDASNRVLSVTDCRQWFWRLGRGGDVPDAVAGYSWGDANRRENPITYTSGATDDPFSGGDKDITSLKDWMSAVMHVLWEAKSGEHWYSQTSRDNMKVAFWPHLQSNGTNFDWDLGSDTLTWSGIHVIFENSSGGYYNIVVDDSAVIEAGQCLYVDIDRQTENVTVTSITGQTSRAASTVTVNTSTNHGYSTGQKVLALSSDANFPGGTKTITVSDANTFTYTEAGSATSSASAITFTSPTYAATVADLQELPAPTIPGSRIIIAWRLGDEIFVRDYPFEVGRELSPVATTTTDGIVRLHATPGDAVHPVVVTMGANNAVAWNASGGNATGLTVGGDGSGNGIEGVGGSAAGIGLYGSGGTAGPGVRGDGGAAGDGVVGNGGSPDGRGGLFTGGGTNGLGAQGTGVGTGTGLYGVGGSTNGSFGVLGTTTATNGTGVGGIGLGTGAGVVGIGGNTAAPGVEGTGGTGGIGVVGLGSGAAAGVRGTGGGTSGIGVEGSGGASNGIGVKGTGDGTGSGVEGYGGDSSGVGGYFAGGASGGTGVVGEGTGVGVGVSGEGGATDGTGVQGIGGGSAGWGGYFEGGGDDSVAIDQNIQMLGSNPSKTVGYTNRLTPLNVAKAFACGLGNGASAPTYTDGFNVASVTRVTNAQLQVTFADVMADANYIVVMAAHSNAAPDQWQVGGKANTGFTISCVDTTSVPFDFVVFGRQ